jgi:hypothetical protein
MSRKPLLAVVALLALGFAGTAEARRRSFGNGGSSYQSNGKFGLGIELGAPTALNGKLFLSPSTALNFGFGYLYDNYYYDHNRDGLYLYLDHLWHPVQLTQNETFKLPFFIGVGGAFWTFDDRHDRFDDHYSALALRVPFGLAFDFNNVPLDIFVQLTFSVDIFFNSAYDRFGPGFEGSVGVRYWFD